MITDGIKPMYLYANKHVQKSSIAVTVIAACPDLNAIYGTMCVSGSGRRRGGGVGVGADGNVAISRICRSVAPQSPIYSSAIRYWQSNYLVIGGYPSDVSWVRTSCLYLLLAQNPISAIYSKNFMSLLILLLKAFNLS